MSSTRGIIVMFAIVIVMLVGSGALLLATRPQPVQITVNPPAPTPTPEPSSTPSPLLVYVTGAVAQPETTITLPPGSRVQDALDAAGGTTADANLELVNLASLLRDGDQVHVPSLSTTTAAVAETLPTASGGALVYVNTATLEELDTLPGIGPALAQRILDHRTTNGAFADLAALDEVSGIGEAMLVELAPLVSFE